MGGVGLRRRRLEDQPPYLHTVGVRGVLASWSDARDYWLEGSFLTASFQERSSLGEGAEGSAVWTALQALRASWAM